MQSFLFSIFSFILIDLRYEFINNIKLLMVFTVANLGEIEAHLATSPALTEGGLPGPLDASIYFAIGKLPDRATTPNLHYWYIFLSSFSPFVLKTWAERAPVAEVKQEVKEEKKAEVKDENDVDLFGDDEEAEPVVEKPKPKVEPKAKKPKPIAKTILVFDVKVYEAETNLDELASKVLGLTIDGLTWNTEYKQLDVAYGIKKLQIGCVIEDDKVMTDDIFDQITAWEDIVQSCDTVSMQKL